MALQLRTNGGVTMLSGSGLVVPPSGGSDRRSQRMGGRQPHAQGRVMAVNGGDGGGVDGGKKKSVPNSNYVVPMDKSFSSPYTSVITRPLVEILRDLNKRIPDNIVKPPPTHHPSSSTFSIPWYHANRMLSFYAPGWCGEIRDVIFSDNGSVTVVYRVTIRGSDGEAHRESTGTVSSTEPNIVDPVAAAEEIAFCRACARFGLGLYLYHEE
ncbi:DNA repair RAD52-like protein 2, chloroplastic [Tripterygium wilfordii]|uniref:DNA repair RAD52-like protein 2, chloroplastic n=1 Tax=Tripterygium wilfordii TaxID=458696 RepID=UPI0018F850E7|nr:DNA repair RAD52-like protein 2, chloroplastic [Tripterygium wilfordii]